MVYLAMGLCREIVLYLTDRPVLAKLATTTKVCSDHYSVQLLSRDRLFRARDETISVYVMWTAGRY